MAENNELQNQQTEQDAPARDSKKKAKKVKYKVPRATGQQDPNLYVGINGVNYVLPRGTTVEVPQFVVDEIERAQRAEDKFYATVDSMKSKP